MQSYRPVQGPDVSVAVIKVAIDPPIGTGFGIAFVRSPVGGERYAIVRAIAGHQVVMADVNSWSVPRPKATLGAKPAR